MNTHASISHRPVPLVPSVSGVAAEFVKLAACIAVGNTAIEAHELAKNALATDRVLRVLQKSAVGAASLDAPGWGTELGASALVGAFLETLKDASIFDTILPFANKVPFRTKFASVTAAATGNIVEAGAPMIVGRLTLASETGLEPQRAYSLIVATQELFRFAVSGSAELFGSQLRQAVAEATDQQFVSGILSATTPIASSGTDADAMRADIAALVAALAPRSNSKLFVVIRPELATKLSLAVSAFGARLFPDMSHAGGLLQKDLPALTSAQIPAGTVLAIDATGVSVATGDITLSSSSAAAIQMRDDPSMNATTPTATTTVSMFQTNSRALKCDRFFGFEVSRDNAVQALSDVDWFDTSGSDA